MTLDEFNYMKTWVNHYISTTYREAEQKGVKIDLPIKAKIVREMKRAFDSIECDFELKRNVKP